MHDSGIKIFLKNFTNPIGHFRRSPGFGLVELIVAVVVTAIISGMMAKLLSESVDVFRYISERKEALQSSRMALQRVARELRQIVSADSIFIATRDSINFDKQGGENISIAWNGKNLDLNSQPLVENIQSFTFKYFDDQQSPLQTPVSDPKKIWKIRFELKTKVKSYVLSFFNEVEPRNF